MPNVFTLSLITIFTIITVHFLTSIELMGLDKSSAKCTIQNQLGILKGSKASSGPSESVPTGNMASEHLKTNEKQSNAMKEK